MKLLGSTTFNDKEYKIEDVRGFHDPKEFGLSEGFYGGRVDKVAGTDDSGVFLLIEKHKVIDIMMVEEECEEDTPFKAVDYSEFTNAELRSMLEEAGIEVPSRATKDELIAMFSMA